MNGMSGQILETIKMKGYDIAVIMYKAKVGHPEGYEWVEPESGMYQIWQDFDEAKAEIKKLTKSPPVGFTNHTFWVDAWAVH